MLEQSDDNLFRKIMHENKKREKEKKPKYILFAINPLAILPPYLFCLFLYLKHSLGKKKNLNIKMPFAINIDNNANLSKRIEEGFIDLSINNSNKRAYEMYMINYSTIDFFDNLIELNVSKWINLKNENINKNDIYFLNSNSNKLYVLCSYVVEKKSFFIPNTSKIQLKKKYQDKFKDIIKLNNENEKEQMLKNIIDEIGLYIPTKIILGGRIDISFEINVEDKEIINSNEDKIFDPPDDLLKKMKNYLCQCKGGSIDFCKNKDKNQWQVSLNDGNMEIISYTNFYKIYNYLDNDLIPYFIKESKRVFSDGVYYGKVENEQRNGYGIFEYNDGSLYEGYWKNNLKYGNGKYKRKDGYEFSGYWENNIMYGNGSLSINGELVYEGQWSNDRKNGYGISYENGKIEYKGQWSNDRKNGYGISYKNEKIEYKGKWDNDKKHDEHGLYYENGKLVYEGQWSNDRKNGYGISYKNEKIEYKGQWANDQYHGEGILYYDSNSWIKARFENGKCLEYTETSSLFGFSLKGFFICG